MIFYYICKINQHVVGKRAKIAGTVFSVLLVVIAGALIALQAPAVQSRIARLAIERLRDRIDGDISIEKILIKPFNALVIKNIAITDDNPAEDPGDPSYIPADTLFSAEYITARMSLKGLFKKEGIQVSRIKVTNAALTLVTEPVREPESGRAFISNIQRIFRTPAPNPADSLKEGGSIFDAGRVEVENIRFRLINIEQRIRQRGSGIQHPAGSIAWDDLDVTASIKGHDLKMTGKVMSGTADMLHAREKSGLTIDDASGKATVGHGLTLVENLEMHIGGDSHLYLPVFSMSYYRTSPFRDFEHRVVLEGLFEPSVVSAATIGYFAPTLKKNPFVAEIEGHVKGPLSALRIDRLKFNDRSSGVSGAVSGLLYGLPQVEKFGIDADIPYLKFTAEGLGEFISGWSSGAALDLSKMAKGETFTFRGTGKGLLNDLHVNGSLRSGIGGLDADARLRNLVDARKDIAIAGHISTSDLDIGRIIDNDLIGELSAETALEAKFGKKSLALDIDSVVISRLNFLDYDYTGIMGTGMFTDKAFDGRIVCNDPNLNFIFQGMFSLSGKTKNAAYRFYANLGYADLYALNIDKRGVSKVSLQTDANFIRISRGDILGDITVADLILENDRGVHDIGTVSIQSHTNEDINRVRFNSSFAEGTYVGSKPFTAMLADLDELTAGRELPDLAKKHGDNPDNTAYSLEILLRDTRELLSFVMPGVYIADSTSLNLNIGRDGAVRGRLSSQRLAYRDKYMRDVKLRADNARDSLHMDFTSAEIKAGGIRLDGNRLQMFASGNRFGGSYTFDNGSEESGKGRLDIGGSLKRFSDDSLVIKTAILPSELYFDTEHWDISSSGITFSGKDISIDKFSAKCGNQSLSIQGGLSPDKSDTLSLNMENFDIYVLNTALRQDFGLQGTASGKVLVISPAAPAHGLLAGITVENTVIAGREAGTLRIASLWDEENERFSLAAREELAGRLHLDAGGWFRPSDRSLDASISFSDFNVGFAEPALISLFSEMHGKLSGQIRASGPLGDIHISSSGTRLSDAGIVLDFTKVPYFIDGPLHIDNKGLHFDNVTLRDRYVGTGTFNGTLMFNDFKEMGIDASAVFRDMECLNTEESDNESFYGNISASGRAGISGPFNAIRLDIEASTLGRPGEIHIPLGSTAITRSSNLLTFTEDLSNVKIDPYEELLKSLAGTGRAESDLSVNLRVNATPDLTALVEVDKSTGNVLTGSGAGVIDITVNPSRDVFNLNGNYAISSGSYHLSVLGIVSRDFTIQDGSSIRFNGDIMDSDLDIRGMYRTKCSLTALLADTSDISSRRTVECGIGVRGKLLNPQLELSVNVPDLDPTTLGRVENALNTEDKVQKQFISLLVANSFLPAEESGIVNNNSLLSVTEIMANQLNTIFQKLDIPLDLGLSYESNGRGQDIFDVALSTQLFNNRVLVNGTLGNKNYGNYSSSQVVGDLEIEVKVNRPGTFRVNLFSRSADQYTNYLDDSQRNGAGVSFQQEFYSFRQYLRDLFKTRKERDEEEVRREAIRSRADKVILKIGEDGKIINDDKR